MEVRKNEREKQRQGIQTSGIGGRVHRAVFRCVHRHWMLLHASAAPVSLHDQPDCVGGGAGLSDAAGQGAHARPHFHCRHAALPVPPAPGEYLGCCGDRRRGGCPCGNHRGDREIPQQQAKHVQLCGLFPKPAGRLPADLDHADYYFADTLERGMSVDFCNTLESMTPAWVLLMMIAGTVIFALLGCVIGRRMFRKHFEKAGMV